MWSGTAARAAASAARWRSSPRAAATAAPSEALNFGAAHPGIPWLSRSRHVPRHSSSDHGHRRYSVLEKVFYTSVLVSDQDEALDFYTNVLGLEKRVENPTPDGPRFLTVGVKGDDFQLVLWTG